MTLTLPALASVSARLTTTSSLLLERNRVVSLHLAPSASSTAQIVRNLTAIRSDLSKLEDEVELEAAGLAVGGSGGRGRGRGSGGKGKKGGKRSEGELANGVRELGERYDRLVDMLAEDDVGSEKAKSLKREQRYVFETYSCSTSDGLSC